MADVVRELLLTETAAQKLGRRGISDREIAQLIDNRYAIVRNPRRRGCRRSRAERRLLIGSTDGGRRLTLVVEPTLEPTTWTVVTGWTSDKRERRLLKDDP